MTSTERLLDVTGVVRVAVRAHYGSGAEARQAVPARGPVPGTTRRGVSTDFY